MSRLVLLELERGQIIRHPEEITINDRALTPERLFQILEDHPHIHFLKAYYRQLVEMFGKAQADREIVDIQNPDLHIDKNYVQFIVTAERSKKPIQIRIANIYRFRGPDDKEFIKWSGMLSGENKLGEPIQTSITGAGYGEKPKYKQTFDRRELEWRPTLEVAKSEPVCTIEWTPKNIKDLSKFFYDESDVTRTRFYFIDYQNRKQACPKEIPVEEWAEWWKTLPRKEMLAKLTDLAARRTASPSAVMV